MKWIKLKRDTSFGKRGSVTQVSEHIAKTRIASGHAVACPAPKKKAVVVPEPEKVVEVEEPKEPKTRTRRKRTKPDNKALSASE